MERTLQAKSWINIRTVIIVILLMIPFNALIFPTRTRRLAAISGVSNPTLDSRPGYTPQQVFSLFSALGPSGRQQYAFSEVTADLAYPILYNLLSFLLLGLTFPKAFPNSPVRPWLTRLPVLTGLADYLENTGIVTLLLIYPTQPVSLAWITCVFTLLKYAFLMTSMLLFFASLAVLGYKKVFNRS